MKNSGPIVTFVVNGNCKALSLPNVFFMITDIEANTGMARNT